MFRIYDGRKAFWQWDLGQKLVVNFDCDEVHFSNGASANALVTKVYEQDGKKLVDVPNVLLQSAKSIKVYAYVVDGDDQHTEVKKVFPVLERTKPEDYVYTPDEVKTWDNLKDEIGDLADLETEAKDNLVAAVNEAAKSGGGDEEEYELVFQETVASDIITYTRDKDKDGTPFSLTDAVVIVFTPPFAESTNRVGRALGCVPNTSWGHYILINISSSTPATTDSSIVGRYDVVYVKVINGYQTVKEYYSSQGDNTNLFSVMQRVTTAGKSGFYFANDKNKIMEIESPQGNITCVKLVSYATAIPAGSIIACYKRKGT